MVDSLAGNDYSMMLCNSLNSLAVSVYLVVNKDRHTEISAQFPIINLLPSKSKGGNRLKKLFDYLAYLFRLIRIINQYQVSIVHFQFFRRPRIDILYCILLRLMNTRLILTVHDVLPLNQNRIDLFFSGISYKIFHRLIVHSEINRKQLMYHFCIPPNKIRVIPHGNFDQYVPENPPSLLEARKNLQLQIHHHVVLFFGYIKPYKGLDLLLDAMEIASQSDKQISLVIAGNCNDDSLRKHYQKRIDHLSRLMTIVSHIQYIPFEKVVDYFIASDLVVLPYHTISHSGLLHLAYSFGKPLIATRVGDFEDFIEQGKSGFVLESNDKNCLAEAIVQAFSDLEKLRRMGSYAKYLNDSRYSWQEIAKETESVYNCIIRKGTI